MMAATRWPGGLRPARLPGIRVVGRQRPCAADVCDGLKPVQRRILYSMDRMGLGYSGPTRRGGQARQERPRGGRCAGPLPPHGDQSAYDALVRMAQDFAQRYPLIDGQGNFGSRDGDGAAAMRYTEARLSRITSLLLDEIDEGTVDFMPNYDGSTEEPRQLPAACRLRCSTAPAASPWAWPPRSPATTCARLPMRAWRSSRRHAEPGRAVGHRARPGLPRWRPDHQQPGDIADAYRTGRGSLKVRARWKIEDMARGQWQLVVTELPPGVSTQRVLEEIEEITNPKVKAGKKALTQDQTQLKASMLAVLDVVRDESSKDAPVRLVFEPKTGKTPQQELITALLAHTSLETSAPINPTMVGPTASRCRSRCARCWKSGSPSARPPSPAAASTG